MSQENQRTVDVYRKKGKMYLQNSDVHDQMDPEKAARKQQKLINLIEKSFTDLPAGAKIFEIGSGSGANAEIMQNMGYDVTASDVSDDFINTTKEKCNKVFQFNVLQDEFPEKYNGIFCWRVFVHFTKEDAAQAISKVYEALEDGGVFIFNAINRKNKSVDSEWVDFDNEYKMGEERYYSYFTEEDLKDIIAKTPFKIADFHTEGGDSGDKWLIFVLKK
jgi:2-polyprenyl-3-methyl-5-hydroxy-6-metoxy-1,4-benzoquinol methylase